MSYLLIMIGAGLGAVARYALTFLEPVIIDRFTKAPKRVYYPWATTMANFLGSFGAGVLIRFFGSSIEFSAAALVTLLVLGFCGALSTMSTFALEVMFLIRKRASVIAFGYTFFSLGGALFMFWLGMVTGTVLSR